MKRSSLASIAEQFTLTANAFDDLSVIISDLSNQRADEQEGGCIEMAAQRIQFAALKMKQAGEELTESKVEKKKVNGKGWIKG